MLITDLMPSEKIIPTDVDVIAEKFKLFVAKMFSSFIFNKQLIFPFLQLLALAPISQIKEGLDRVADLFHVLFA